MFNNCTELIETPVLNNLVYAWGAFKNCTKLVKSNVVNTNIRSAESCYENCVSLERIDSNFDNLQSADYLFYGCENLTSVPTSYPKLLFGARMFAKCYKLSAVQLVEIINNIYDLRERPGMGISILTFPSRCRESNDTKTYLETNYPAALALATTKQWKIDYM